MLHREGVSRRGAGRSGGRAGPSFRAGFVSSLTLSLLVVCFCREK